MIGPYYYRRNRPIRACSEADIAFVHFSGENNQSCAVGARGRWKNCTTITTNHLGMHLTPPVTRLCSGWEWQMSKIIRGPLLRWKADFFSRRRLLRLFIRVAMAGRFCCPNCTNGRAWRSSRGLWLCSGCRRQVSVLAGTVFQDTHLPMRTWFRAMWCITSQKNGMSALGLQRVLGLGSYRTAWLMLHKLRQAMVRPGRDRLCGEVEVDETYWGSAEFGGATGRKTLSKVLIIVAAEADGKRIGRIRMALIEDFDRKRSTASFKIILSWEARFARTV